MNKSKLLIADEEGYTYEVSVGIQRQLEKTYEKGTKEYVDAAGNLLDIFKVNPRRFFENAFIKVGHVNAR
jgi:hypothetical protein